MFAVKSENLAPWMETTRQMLFGTRTIIGGERTVLSSCKYDYTHFFIFINIFLYNSIDFEDCKGIIYDCDGWNQIRKKSYYQ